MIALDDGSVYSVDAADQGTVSSWTDGDSITVSDDGSSAFDSSTGDQVSVTSVGTTSDNNAYSGGGPEPLSGHSDDGSLVVLDDGSIWEVDVGDQATSGPWTDGDSITVVDHSDGSYSLVDTDDQSEVSANYIGNE